MVKSDFQKMDSIFQKNQKAENLRISTTDFNQITPVIDRDR